ncbi:MAG: riboflavin biosynthesis protein RibF [Phycisphaerae bacterium]|nr:riboflavin biosynthesis protein RibF [Phycisphaerae bacterium]
MKRPMPYERHIVGLENVPESLHGCALTIGNFDGVHRGHRRIVSHARALADAEHQAVVAVTFDPPPDLVLRPGDEPQRVGPHDETVENLLQAGCDAIVTVKTNLDLLHMSPQAFIDEVILKHFAPRHVVEGPNFFFGRGRAGTIATLQTAGPAGGFLVHVVDPVMVELDGEPTRVSSTLIRALIKVGRVDAAGDLLTRPFALTGTVVHGDHLGRTLRYPTANLERGEQIVPADGVYAGSAKLGETTYPAAISIGYKPTFADDKRTIEAHLVGAGGDFYGRRIRVAFLSRLRDQMRYNDTGSLVDQIARDVEQTKGIVNRAFGIQ